MVVLEVNSSNHHWEGGLPSPPFSPFRAHSCEYGEPGWSRVDDLDRGLYLSIPFFSFVTGYVHEPDALPFDL